MYKVVCKTDILILIIKLFYACTFSKKFSWEIENNNNSVYKPITDTDRDFPISAKPIIGRYTDISADTDTYRLSVRTLRKNIELFQF